MASPIGHTLGGIAASTFFWRQFPVKNWVFWGAILLFANLADFDYLFGFIAGNPNTYHRLWMHSVGFMLLIGLLVLVIQKIRAKEWQKNWFVFAVTLMGSHLLIDYLGVDTRGEVGIPLFWPVTYKNFISPVSLFRDIMKSSSSSNFIQSLFSSYNLWTIIQEIVILGIVLVLALFILNKTNRLRAYESIDN